MMPSYGKRRDEDAGLFHDGGGMFSDDPEDISARITAAGVFVPVECTHCGDEVIFELAWPEVVAMGQHAPVQSLARTSTGYSCRVVCERCHRNYESEGWGEQRTATGEKLSDAEAGIPLDIGLNVVRRWLHRGKKFARAAAAGAAPATGKRAPVGWRMYQHGMVGGIPCKRCKSIATAKLYWPDVIKLVQGQPGSGWDPHGGGFIRPLSCPACKGRVVAGVSVAALNKWLAAAIKRGLVR